MNSNKLKKIYRFFAPISQPVLAITLALFVGAIAILMTGESPLNIYKIMLKGAFGSEYYLLTTLTRATPIIITGLGAAICWSSNYMGIGGEGQMIMGGFICAVTAFHFPGPQWVKLISAVILALAGSGLYSLFTAWLLDKFKMSLAISTLMLNYAAAYIAMHFVQNVFLDKTGDAKLVQTQMIDESIQLPRIVEGQKLHWGFGIAVVLVIAIWFLMNRTSFGYESKMSGFNIDFCNYGGISSRKIMYGMLMLSGMICGLAGVIEVLGVNYRYVHNTYVSSSYAWIGLNAALISGYNPIGILITSIVLAGISTGGGAIARSTSVPLEISTIIQGCITLFISARIVIQFKHSRKKPAASFTGGDSSGGNMVPEIKAGNSQ
ncbi:MAG: ABC transporter permease [Flexilinea sp.]